MEQSFERGIKYDRSHPVAPWITEAMMAMLLLDLRPISTINAVGFTQLIEVLCPRYQIPSQFYLTQKDL